MAEKETEVQRLAKKYQASLSTSRPGGWREERSPDGRMTMYISPKGERLSREEFADKYPQGTGDGSTVAAGMMKDIASGRNLPQLPDQENLKIGVILQPRGEPWNPRNPPKPSQDANFYDELIKREMNFAKPNVEYIRQWRKAQANAVKQYNATEAGQAPTPLNTTLTSPGDMGERTTRLESDLYTYARDRARPIPFPDKK